MFKNKLIGVIMAVIMFAVLLPMAIPSATAAEDPVKQNLTEAKRQELNSFFERFLATPFPIGDYDREDLANCSEVALKYAIAHIAYTDYTWNGWIACIAESSVEYKLLTLFDIHSIQHRTISSGFDSRFDFIYENNSYHRELFNGWYLKYPDVVEFRDNANGTYSVKLEISDYGEGSWDPRYRGEEPERIYYASAVIQPTNNYGETIPYQLLYWKNNVGKDEPLPVRQSTSSVEVTFAANPTASTVLVNGGSVAFDAYNIEGNNYFKLRDLAYVLNGTAKQFSIWYDESLRMIFLDKGYAYTPVGGEMTSKGSGSKAATPTTARVFLNGREISLTAYNIDGNNYFKLRDIGQAFDFGVTWDGANNTIVIDTSKGYEPENQSVFYSQSRKLSTSERDYLWNNLPRELGTLGSGVDALEADFEGIFCAVIQLEAGLIGSREHSSGCTFCATEAGKHSSQGVSGHTIYTYDANELDNYLMKYYGAKPTRPLKIARYALYRYIMVEYRDGKYVMDVIQYFLGNIGIWINRNPYSAHQISDDLYYIYGNSGVSFSGTFERWLAESSTDRFTMYLQRVRENGEDYIRVFKMVWEVVPEETIKQELAAYFAA